VSQNDPTDQTLAAIASILDKPEAPPEAEQVSIEENPLAPENLEADGYHKIGPGPIASIRFRWTARRGEDGQYYVDETIGEGAAPVTTGPMSRDAAISLIDERESDARRRFENLRSEMAGRSAVADLFRRDSGEA
jgi:hypothetical protein